MEKAAADEHGQHRLGFYLPVDDEISLRLVEPQHAPEIFAAVEAGRETVRRWLCWVDGTKVVEDVRNWAQEAQYGYGDGKRLPASVIYRGRVVGGAGFTEIECFQRPGWGLSRASAEVGYWLTPDACGKGVMTRCVKALATYGFRELGFHRIHIRAEPENVSSWRVAERAGFLYEGVMRGVCHWKQDGKTRRVDHKVYAAIAEEWGV